MKKYCIDLDFLNTGYVDEDLKYFRSEFNLETIIESDSAVLFIGSKADLKRFISVEYDDEAFLLENWQEYEKEIKPYNKNNFKKLFTSKTKSDII